MTKALFTFGLRTPFGRAVQGAYADVRSDDLLVELLVTQCQRHEALVDRRIDDLIVGTAYPEGEQGYNIGRMAALGCGLETPGCTVNRLCASSLEAIAMAAGRIAGKFGSVYLVGGIESMSRITRRGAGFSESDRIKKSVPLAYISMGDTAEEVALQFPNITRSMQEDLAASSHENAAKAYERGDYAGQIHAYKIARDEFIRVPVNREKIASLMPAFREGGTVTAATSSPLTDGATSGWVVDFETAKACGIRDGLEIVDVAVAHVKPEWMGMGPVPAMRSLLRKQNLRPDDIDVYEINEAFAIQVLACGQELELPMDRVNRWGGAMAIGHPLGATGLRLAMTAHARLAQQNKPGSLGIASLCVGGGQGMAILFRWVEIE